MNTKLKYFFRGALVAFALVSVMVVARVGAAVYSGIGHLIETPQFFEAMINVNEGVTYTPVDVTGAITLSLTEAAYDVDTTAGAFVISLPDASVAATTPADGQCWRARLTVANGAVSFSPSAVGDLLNGSQAAYAGVDAVGDSIEICYDAETTNYNIQSSKIN